MLPLALLPASITVAVDGVVLDGGAVTLLLRATSATAACPLCRGLRPLSPSRLGAPLAQREMACVLKTTNAAALARGMSIRCRTRQKKAPSAVISGWLASPFSVGGVRNFPRIVAFACQKGLDVPSQRFAQN
jgi:hypothetical protein